MVGELAAVAECKRDENSSLKVEESVGLIQLSPMNLVSIISGLSDLVTTRSVQWPSKERL